MGAPPAPSSSSAELLAAADQVARECASMRALVPDLAPDAEPLEVLEAKLRALRDDAATAFEIAMQTDNPPVDVQLDAIRAFSAADAARWPEFVAFMNTCAQMLDAAYAVPMPRELPHLDLRREGLPFAKLGLRLRRLGKRDMFRFIRARDVLFFNA